MRSSRSQFAGMLTRAVPGLTEIAWGTQSAVCTRGACFAPPGGLVENLVRPCTSPLLTLPNSPAMETYPAVPVIDRPACPRPEVVPTRKSGNQLYAEGAGVPLQSL